MEWSIEKLSSIKLHKLSIMKTTFKTILAPTDFSDAANNAINYAAELAKLTQARLILMHVYYVPLLMTDLSVSAPTTKEQKEGYLQVLNKQKKELMLHYGNDLKVDVVCIEGFTVAEIERYSTEHEVDLIVMGMKGIGRVEERLFGSNTTTMIEKGICPVLVIDETVTYKQIKNIVLAADYEKIQHQRELLAPLNVLAQLTEAHVYILNIVEKIAVVPSADQAIVGIQLDHVLENTPHTFHHYQYNDIGMGIRSFTEEYKIDVIVMIPHDHSFFSKLFKESMTKQLAFHTQLPLLAIHS